MAAVLRVLPAEIFSEVERKAIFQKSYWRGLLLVAHAWAVISLALLVAVFFPHPLVWLLAIPVIGARQLGLAVLMHEAAHRLLHPNRRLNDWVGLYLCGLPTAVSLHAYRNYHFKHHRFTQQAEDPDLRLSSPFPRSSASLIRKAVRDLTGQTFFRQFSGLLLVAMGRMSIGNLGSRAEARLVIIGFLACACLLTGGIYLLTGTWAGLLWILSFSTWFQLVLRIRNIAEHACTSISDDPFTHARTTRAGPVERIFIAPYWVNFHAEHHLFMFIPCYRLKEAHEHLMRRGHGVNMTIASSYAEVLSLVTTVGREGQRA